MGPMTTDDAEGSALAVYEKHPMAAGDAVLLLDGRACVELEALADVWVDDDVPLLVEMITEHSRRTDVELSALQVLPAA